MPRFLQFATCRTDGVVHQATQFALFAIGWTAVASYGEVKGEGYEDSSRTVQQNTPWRVGKIRTISINAHFRS